MAVECQCEEFSNKKEMLPEDDLPGSVANLPAAYESYSKSKYFSSFTSLGCNYKDLLTIITLLQTCVTMDDRINWKLVAMAASMMDPDPKRSLFTVDTCLEIAKCIEEYVTQNKKENIDLSSQLVWSNMESLLDYFPGILGQVKNKISDTKVLQGVFNDAQDEDHVLVNIIKKHLSDFNSNDEHNQKFWKNVTNDFSALVYYNIDVKYYILLMKAHYITVTGGNPPILQDAVSMAIEPYMQEIFEYIEPTSEKREEFLKQANKNNEEETNITSRNRRKIVNSCQSSKHCKKIDKCSSSHINKRETANNTETTLNEPIPTHYLPAPLSEQGRRGEIRPHPKKMFDSERDNQKEAAKSSYNFHGFTNADINNIVSKIKRKIAILKKTLTKEMRREAMIRHRKKLANEDTTSLRSVKKSKYSHLPRRKSTRLTKTREGNGNATTKENGNVTTKEKSEISTLVRGNISLNPYVRLEIMKDSVLQEALQRYNLHTPNTQAESDVLVKDICQPIVVPGTSKPQVKPDRNEVCDVPRKKFKLEPTNQTRFDILQKIQDGLRRVCPVVQGVTIGELPSESSPHHRRGYNFSNIGPPNQEHKIPPEWFNLFLEDYYKYQIWTIQQFIKIKDGLMDTETEKLDGATNVEKRLSD